MNLDLSSNISERLNDDSNKYPTTIELKETIVYSDSLGLWLRFKDGTYHNPLCPLTGFDLSMFENKIKNGKAEIKSYEPHSKSTLLSMFPEDKLKTEYNLILELYKDDK
jgi:hypothetical protein